MTIQQLEYVYALNLHRNFVKAAQHCLVTQPTLTMQIHKLEEEIGFRIFDRSQKPLGITRLGESFISKSQQIIREMNELKALVSGEIESVKGSFRLGTIPTLAPYLLPGFLSDFTKKNSETQLVIEELQSEDIIHRLKNNLLDIAILATPLDERQLREIPLFNEAFLAYLPENDPLLANNRLRASDIKSNNLLLLSEGHCFRNQALNICELEDESTGQKFQYQSGSIETLMRLVDQGLGYTLVPELAVFRDVGKNPRLKKFEDPVPSREISLVCHSSFSREKLLETLREHIFNCIPTSFKRSREFIRVKWR